MMVERERKYSINVTFDQHESIPGMKRGKDTVYDVVDRLLARDQNLNQLEERIDKLGYSIINAVEIARALRVAIENGIH